MYGSNIPKPSNIPRPPRSTAARPAVQVQPSRLPTNFSLKVHKSRVAEGRDGRNRLDLETTTNQAKAPGQDAVQTEDDPSAPIPYSIGGSTSALAIETEAKTRTPNEDLVTSIVKSPGVRRRPRPSLSERTIETLSQIPPSPSPRRRKSGIYPADVPGSSFPGSSASLVESRAERSFGQRHIPSTPRGGSPIKRQVDSVTYNPSANPTPTRRSVSSFVPKSLPRSSRGVYGANDLIPSKVPPVAKLPPNNTENSSNHGVFNPPLSLQEAASDRDSGPSVPAGDEIGHEISRPKIKKPNFRAQTYAPKSTRQRMPLDGLFSRQSSDTVSGQSDRLSSGIHGSSSKVGSKVKGPSRPALLSKGDPSRTLKDLNQSVPTSPIDLSLKKSDSPKSSAALRETIAKAKEARRAAAKLRSHETLVTKKFPTSVKGNEDNNGEFSDEKVLRKRMNVARTSGRLNIAALGLSELPKYLKDMYHIENIDVNSGEWYESVDLVRLMAADNELEFLPDWAFPDISLEVATDPEEGHLGNIFGGLQSIDLHGNNLSELPCGLQRLTHLTSVNLSRNRLANTCIGVLSQIPSIQELRLAKNSLKGALEESLGNLVNLEVLDLQDNSITDLGLALKDLTKLRNLAVAGNHLASIPSYVFESLPLTEINAARNQLAGTLIPEGLNDLAALRTLDVSKNALTAIAKSERLSLLSLQDLNVADNRLCAFPDASGWTSLITLCAGGNKLISIPEGLTSLPKLKILDLSRNSIIQLDSRLGLMDSLTSLEVGNNPLRERRLLSMKTDDLKQALRDRLPLPPNLSSHSEEAVSNGPVSMNTLGSSTRETTWPMKPGGVVDRSSTNLHALETSHLELIIQITDIKSLIFHHNRLSCIPIALSLTKNTLTALDLSHNSLANESYLHTALSLPYLRSLDISSNTISNLSPLTTSLDAPLLSLLNVSYNRLHSLPPLRTTYPSMTTLLASNNNISTLEFDVAKGLNVLNVSENAIERLEPRLGLLAAHGLRTLLVGGNRFRVPRREILERGTDALLAWLMGRLPAGEVEEVDGVGFEG